MAMSSASSGQIVAFEGHPEIISTQLRLLPMSPQVLVLPPIESYLASELGKDFSSTEYVRKTHDAVKRRNEAARTFLDGATPEDKRLVFLNGGTPSAQTLCIRAIMKNGTSDDDEAAEDIFQEIVRRGVSGLDETQSTRRPLEQRKAASKQEEQHVTSERSSTTLSGDRPEHPAKVVVKMLEPAATVTEAAEQQGLREDEDPITRAMRAADALDRETASLQPSNELDLTIPTSPLAVARQRSNSLPLCEYSDNSDGEVAPFYVFGAQEKDDFETIVEEEEEEMDDAKTEDGYIVPSPNFAITHFEDTPEPTVYPEFSDEPDKAPNLSDFPRPAVFTPGRPEPYTPFSESFGPRSPGEVVFGEASLLDMRPSAQKPPVTRVRSLDRIYPSSPKFRDICLPIESPNSESSMKMGARPTRPKSIMITADQNDPSAKRLDYIDGPRTIVVRPKREIAVTVAPVPGFKRRQRTNYVDRGTDAEDLTPRATQPFEPILPLTEDLIIYFKDENPDLLLDRVVEAFKAAKYPILETPSQENQPKSVQVVPPTPESQSVHEAEVSLEDEAGVAEEDVDEQEEDTNAAVEAAGGTVTPTNAAPSTDEYDPFAYVHPIKTPPSKAVSKSPGSVPTIKYQQPPTPEKTPTPSVAECKGDRDERFHEFEITSSQTAVAVQNSLRSILNLYFPPETAGYRQFQSSILPELDGYWNPVFRELESSNSNGKNKRRVDQILAVGSQHGVLKEYSSAIIGQLEKLGSKSSGLSRSGRLDFRYLLANAIQAFTTQPLSAQSSNNPFTDPHLLATMILPHLETYLVLHSEARYLLLEYPAEHLGTILALQRLIGVDLFKVAQIVDAKGKDLPFSDMSGTSVTKPQTSSLKRTSTRGPSEVLVAKANFILTSAATDSEIADFISTVWKILGSISSFYKPETSSKRRSQMVVEKVVEKVVERPVDQAAEKQLSEKLAEKEKKRPPPLTSSFSAFPKITEVSKSPMSAAPASIKAFPSVPVVAVPVVPADPPSRPGSIAETTRTFKSFRSKQSRAVSRKRPATGGQDAISVYTFNPEEDSDYDEEERRLMPIFLQKRQVRKGNSRKALKFLGLA